MIGRRLAISIPEFDHTKFLSKIKIIDECWEWQGATFKAGYGQIRIKTKLYQTHRVSFHIFKGGLVNDLLLDHKCKNRKCCNPKHLRQVTCKVNSTENSDGITSVNKLKTHCKRGHEFTSENTYKRPLGRECRICMKK